MAKKAKPIQKPEEVKQNPDPHIDQDFPGFPHPPSKEEQINPKKKKAKKIKKQAKKK